MTNQSQKHPLTLSLKLTLLLVSSLTIMAGATISPSLPQIAEIFRDVPQAEFLSKLILTMPALAIAIFSPSAGYLVDKYGRLPILLPSLILYAISGGIGFFIHNLYIILFGRVILGISVACIMTTSITLIGDYFEGEERVKFIGTQAAFMSLGGAVFVGVGGFLADLDWSYPFLIYLFSVLIFFGASNFLFEPPKIVKKEKVSFIKDTTSSKVIPILGVAFFSMIIFYMLPVQLPFFLKEIGINKNSFTGIAISCTTLAATVTGFFYGQLRKKMSINIIFILVFTFMALGYFLISISHSFYLIIIAMIITGLGMGLLMPNINTWLLQIVDVEKRGQFIGFLSSALFLGQFVSPLIVSPIHQWFDLNHIFLMAAFLLFLGAILFGVIHFFTKRN